MNRSKEVNNTLVSLRDVDCCFNCFDTTSPAPTGGHILSVLKFAADAASWWFWQIGKASLLEKRWHWPIFHW